MATLARYGQINISGIKFKKSSIHQDNIGYILITPFLLFTFVFILLPIIMNIYLSFTNYDLQSAKFVGIKNYIRMFDDKVFLVSVKNSFIYTFYTLFFLMALGLLSALALKHKIFGLRFFRTSFYLPYVTSMVSVSMIWLWMYEPSHGMINQLLGNFGIPGKQWLYDVNLAMGSIIVMSIWKAIGYNMVIYLAGLHNIPGYLYEASRIDGSNVFQDFYYITWPMIKPITFFLFVTGFINNFKVFEQVMIMTNGGPVNSTTTIVHQIYNRAFQDYQVGYAASEAIFLLAIVAAATLLNFKFGNQGHDLDIG